MKTGINILTAIGAKPATRLNWTAQQDHKDMMNRLGIIRLRPGLSGQPRATNSANYDPAKANPFPDLPELLTLKHGFDTLILSTSWRLKKASCFQA
jgi:hypothetical protein